MRTGWPRFLTQWSGNAASGRRARRSRSGAGTNVALTTHERLTGLLCRRRREHGLPADDHLLRQAVGHAAAKRAEPMCVKRTARPSGPMSAPAPRGGRPGAARPTPRRHRVVVCVQSPGIHACTKFVSKIQLRPRRAPHAFAAFRLATIYLPQFLLLKWVVVKYTRVPLTVAGG